VVQGGAYVNGENIRDIEKNFEIEVVKNGAVLLRAGKKRYFRFSID
jgi:tyrosyl-tRNA synthetase